MAEEAPEAHVEKLLQLSEESWGGPSSWALYKQQTYAFFCIKKFHVIKL